MTITSQQIHSVLRTYGKQLRRGQRLNRIRSAESKDPVDTIQISPQAKRQQVVDRVASDILSRMADQGPGDNDVERDIMKALSAEYGRQVDMRYNSQSGRFDFYDVSSGGQAKPTAVGPADQERLNSLLQDTARRVVDRTMI